jgi:hypothetical protein
MKITLSLPVLLLSAGGLLLGGAGLGYFLKPGPSLLVDGSGERSAPSERTRVTTVGERPGGAAPLNITTGGPGSASPGGATASAAALPITLAELREQARAMMSQGWGGRGASAFADMNERLLVSDLPGLAAALAGEPTEQAGDVSFHLIMNSWGQRDGVAAWNFAVGLPNGPRRNSAMMASLQGIMGEDVDAAWRLVETLQDDQMGRQMRSTVLMTLAHQDPARAFALATASGGHRDDDFSLPMVISQWARQDMAAAQAAVASLSGQAQERARSALLSAMAQSDPAAAWNYAMTLPSNAGEPHRDPRLTVLQTWGNTNPKDALQAALTLPVGALRNTAITTTLSQWAQNDFSAALDYAVGVSDSTLRSEALRTLSQNRMGDPSALFQAVLEHMPAGDNFQRAIDGIFRSWARENPQAAAAALSQLPSSRLQAQATRNLVQEWANTSIDQALRFTQNLPAGEARNSSLEAVYRQWSSTDLPSALRSFQSLSGEDRRAVLNPMASTWGRQDPNGALAWSSALTEPSDRRDFQRQVVTQWAETAPREAAQYAIRLPEEDRSGVLQAAVDRWASRDAEGAANWLASQPSGEWKDGAIGSLARKIAPEDPAVALAWLGSMSNENQRSRQVERVFREWLRQDRADAQRWLQQSGLPAEERERLLR